MNHQLAQLEDAPVKTLREILLTGKVTPWHAACAKESGTYNPAPHVPIWYSLAKAHLDAGNEEEALRWFRRVAESAHEHIEWPIPYVRSFYFLGTLHESRGEAEKAQSYYRRFVDLWGEGEIDRDRVQEARNKL